MTINPLLKTVAGSAIALATLSALPVAAGVPDYDQIFIFGDSLSDAGNDFAATGGIFPPQPYDRRFSNGPVWAEYFAADLGLNPSNFVTLPPNSPIPNDGINYAFGGATTGTGNLGNPPFPFIGLTQQIQAFANLSASQPVDENALYVVWAGSNDYIGGLPPNPAATVGNLSTAIEALINTGARDILVVNQPDLGFIPLIRSQGPEAVAGLNGATEAHNGLLSQQVNRLGQLYPQANLISFDVNSLYDEVLADPGKFGFSDVVTPCNGSNVYQQTPVISPDVCDNPDASLFWDTAHPTTAAHKIIADRAIKRISVPEPGVVPALGLLGLLLAGRAIRKH